MKHQVNELGQIIVQKNYLLNSIDRKDISQKEKIKKLESELDTLLYRYYKLMKK